MGMTTKNHKDNNSYQSVQNYHSENHNYGKRNNFFLRKWSHFGPVLNGNGPSENGFP